MVFSYKTIRMLHHKYYSVYLLYHTFFVNGSEQDDKERFGLEQGYLLDSI